MTRLLIEHMSINLFNDRPPDMKHPHHHSQSHTLPQITMSDIFPIHKANPLSNKRMQLHSATNSISDSDMTLSLEDRSHIQGLFT